MRGMGFDYWDLYNATNPESCDPKDSACVARNQAKANATEDLWVSQYMTNPATADAAVPQFTVNTGNQQALTSAFMANQPVEASIYIPPPPAPVATTNTVGSSRGVTTVTTPATVTNKPPIAPTNPTDKSAGGRATQYVSSPINSAPTDNVINSGGVQSLPTDAPGAFHLTDLSLLAVVPWWGWALGAGALLFAFGGSGRGR